ncbi:MAG: transposase [Nitrosopumilus sp.]|nr:transposase [Nitrosopumilus sp.]
MLTKSTPDTGQLNLFHSELFSQLDTKDPLIQLANTINWPVFDNAFEKYYSKDNGRPSKPIRLMVGLLILKQLENLSDERVVLQFKRNPYYQYFYPSRGY